VPPGPLDHALSTPTDDRPKCTSSADVVLTGERTWPGIAQENYWFSRHVACYRWAATQITASVPTVPTIAKASISPDQPRPHPILDAGAGEGYGCEMLSSTTGAPVVAFDLDRATMEHLISTYRDVTGVLGNLVALPFRDRVFEAAVSLQVVEHVWDPIAYLSELDRCTLGPIIISTPNRPVHSPGLTPGATPVNPFHVREFDADELRALLTWASPARSVVLHGLRHGDRIQEWERRHGSLPAAVIGADATALNFAATVTEKDFTICPIADDDEAAHDLIALW